MTGRQFADVGEKRGRRHRVAQREIIGQCPVIQPPRHLGQFEDGLDFRGKGELAAVPIVVQRLDADAIAGDEQRALHRIEDRESEHAVEPLQGVRAPLDVGLQEHLGVAARAKRPP